MKYLSSLEEEQTPSCPMCKASIDVRNTIIDVPCLKSVCELISKYESTPLPAPEQVPPPLADSLDFPFLSLGTEIETETETAIEFCVPCLQIILENQGDLNNIYLDCEKSSCQICLTDMKDRQNMASLMGNHIHEQEFGIYGQGIVQIDFTPNMRPGLVSVYQNTIAKRNSPTQKRTKRPYKKGERAGTPGPSWPTLGNDVSWALRLSYCDKEKPCYDCQRYIESTDVNNKDRRRWSEGCGFRPADSHKKMRKTH